MKVCKTCKEEKKDTEFNKCGKYLQSHCKPCESDYHKRFHNINRARISEKNKIRWHSLSQEQKSLANSKKKRIEVSCSGCDEKWLKRMDSIKSWDGLCRSCAQRKYKSNPEVKMAMGERARIQVLKQGGIPNAHHFKKGELAGDKHHNWGMFRDKHPRWISDRSKLKVDNRRGLRHNYWAKECKKRDGHKCKIGNQDCSGRLEVHHILSWKEYPELRNDMNNGITLCHFHHPRKKVDEKRLSNYFTGLLSTG